MENVSYISVKGPRARAGPLRGLGGVEPWERTAAETDEVYLWRAKLSGLKIRSIEDMQAIARAVGRGEGLGLDLRGIAVTDNSDGSYSIDAAMTAKAPLVYAPLVFNDAAQVGQAVKTELTSRFPNLVVSGAHFDQITDAEPRHPALDFWLSHSVLWDLPWALFPAFEKGQPTGAFARFEGLYQGNAEQGLDLKPWPRTEPSIGPTLASSSSSTVLWLAGGAVALYVIYRLSSRQGYQGAAA